MKFDSYNEMSIFARCDCNALRRFDLSDVEIIDDKVILKEEYVCNKCNKCHTEVYGYSRLGQLDTKQTINKKPEEIKRDIELLLVLSCGSIEGRKILEYNDIITSEIVLGTGIFSDVSSKVSDVFGKRAHLYEDKLVRAKDSALYNFKVKAYNLGADAVISTKIDYETIGDNMLMIIISGTPVKLENIIEQEYG